MGRHGHAALIHAIFLRHSRTKAPCVMQGAFLFPQAYAAHPACPHKSHAAAPQNLSAKYIPQRIAPTDQKRDGYSPTPSDLGGFHEMNR